MNTDSFAGKDFIFILEKLINQLENSPGPIGTMVKDLKGQLDRLGTENIESMLEDIDLSQIEELFQELATNDETINMENLVKNPISFFQIASNPKFREKFNKLFGNFPVDIKVSHNKKATTQEPYFEIHGDIEDEHGKVIVDLPSIQDIRNVEWTCNEGILKIHTINVPKVNYALEVNLKTPVRIESPLASLNNGVLTIPFKKLRVINS